MDVLETPLNLAHQQGRLAENHVNAGRYEEAVRCHQNAAEYLSEAMALTNVPIALESMRLQREQHLETARRVQQRRSSMGATAEMEGTVTNASLGTVTDEPVDHRTLVYNTMEECDSLLQFLNDRHKSGGSGNGNGKDPPAQPEKVAYQKVAKDDQQIIEELRLHNDALRDHILDLLNECEEHRANRLHLENENKMLKYKLEKLQNQRNMTDSQESSEQEETIAPPGDINLDAIPDLPPLEMPQFDFESFSPRDRSDQDKPSSI